VLIAETEIPAQGAFQMIRSRGTTQTLQGMYRISGPSLKPYRFDYRSIESSEGTSHPEWNRSRGGDVGGPWFLSKHIYEINPIIRNDSYGQGPIWGTVASGFQTSPALLNLEADLKAIGTKQIAAATPNNPAFSLATAIGELRADGLPAIVGTDLLKERARQAKYHSRYYRPNKGDKRDKAAASEFLNVEFGWKPLVSDLTKFAMSVRHHHKLVDGYLTHGDSKIRRRLASPPTYETNQTGNTSVYLQPGVTIGPWVGTGSTFESTETRTWFSGAFRYHIPMGNDLGSRLARYNAEAGKLLGVRLTPDVVWNLMPWSWAADWFTDMGSIMTNISNLGTDGMVMQYGYSMRSQHREMTTSFNWQGKSGYFRETTITKRRLPASPYGFNTTFDGLSNRQKAICAALGITRVR
jgi:hypothetical protein